MQHDDAGKNILDFLKLAFKIIVLLIGLQLIFNITNTKIDLPYVQSTINFIARWFDRTFGGSGFGI
jgi:hypothetical protein